MRTLKRLCVVACTYVLMRFLATRTFSNYVNTGPFTNNTTPPGISATFLNNLETFLDSIIAPAVNDSHLTSDGNGNATFNSLTFTHGKITRIAFGFAAVTTGGTTVTHNLGATPSGAFATVSNVGSSIVAQVDSTTLTTTTMKVSASSNANVWWLAIA